MPTPSAPPLVPGPALFTQRAFVADMAVLAEGCVMADMHTAATAPGGGGSFWAAFGPGTSAEGARRAMESREQYPAWAPDKVGEHAMKPASEAAECEVRRRRSEWATALKERYSPEALAWADPAQGMEKAAAVTLLHPPPDLGCGDDPLIVVAFRGSKAASDYFVTDASPRFVPLRRSVDLSGTGTLEDGGTYEYDFTPPEDASQRPRRSLAGIARTATFARRLSISRRSERAAKPGAGAAVEAGAEEGGEGGAGDGGSLEVSVQEAERRRASCPPLRTPCVKLSERG
jgi:hypothetical protein